MSDVTDRLRKLEDRRKQFDEERFESNLRCLDLLRELCTLQPTQRLGQIIANSIRTAGRAELFYIEPQNMEAALREEIDIIQKWRADNGSSV